MSHYWKPHPCGFRGDPKRKRRCTPQQVEKYRERISGPLPDRIDLHVEAPAVAFDELRSTEHSEPSAAIRERVVRVREKQRALRRRQQCAHQLPHEFAAGPQILRPQH